MSTGTRLAEIWTRTMRPDETRARTPAGTRAMTSGIPSPPRLRTPLLLALLAAIVSLATLHGCEDVQVTAVEVASVTVSPSQATLLPGETVQLTATPQGASGNLLGDRPVTWRSDDTSLAKVSSSGVVEGLTPGQTVIRASAGDAEGTATITVGAPPRIAISPAQITLHAVAGDDGSQAESVAITNDGAGTLSGLTTTVTYPSGEPQGWLDASLDGSQAPATLTLQASPAQLAEGTYQAQVEVGSEAADNSPRVVEVELEVGAAPARIALSTSSVGFVWEEGQSPPAAQPVGVTNEGGGNLTGLALSVAYVEEGNPEWLSAELEDTTAPTEISLQVHPGSLGTGMYNATVEVRSPAAANSAQELRVRLTVGAPPPEIELIPDAVQWSTNEGESPSGRTVQVQNQGSGELGDLAASVSYAAGESTGWLSAQLNGTTAPTTLQLSVQADDLLPGTYSATVDLTSPDAVNSPQLVAATLQVNASVDPEQSEINAAPGVLPADGVATSTITVRLRDLQGDPMSTGGADVQLSTTRGTLSSVSDRGDGTYTATLRAPTSVGEGVVTGTVNGSVIADNAVVRFVPGEASPATSTITADPRSLPADGSSTSTLTVQLRDAHGNHLTEGGHEVTLALEGAGSLGGVTDRSDGTYTATYTAGSEVGSAVITGRLDGQTMDDQAVVTLGTGDVSPETSQVEANPHTDVTADGSTASEVTVQLRDSGNNPIGGLGNADFDIALTDGQGGGTDASHSTVTETSTAGTYTFDVTNTTAEVVTVIVTARSTTLNDQPTIQFVAGDAEPTLTIVSGNRQEGTVGEALDDALVVRVTDGQGDPVSGVAVTWDPDDDGSADPTSSTTGSNGQASTTWTLGDEVGEQTLTASADGVSESVTFIATAGRGKISASESSVEADPDSDVLADGEDASTVTVELRNAEDDPVGGVPPGHFKMTLTVNGTESTTASRTPVRETSTAGTYTFRVRNSAPEEVTVTVTADGTTLDDKPTIEFVEEGGQ
jgi:adhesin/invasin